MKKDDFQLRKQAESDWNSSADIRAEFESMEQYFHFLKAKENGQIRMLGKKL